MATQPDTDKWYRARRRQPDNEGVSSHAPPPCATKPDTESMTQNNGLVTITRIHSTGHRTGWRQPGTGPDPDHLTQERAQKAGYIT